MKFIKSWLFVCTLLISLNSYAQQPPREFTITQATTFLKKSSNQIVKMLEQKHYVFHEEDEVDSFLSYKKITPAQEFSVNLKIREGKVTIFSWNESLSAAAQVKEEIKAQQFVLERTNKIGVSTTSIYSSKDGTIKLIFSIMPDLKKVSMIFGYES